MVGSLVLSCGMCDSFVVTYLLGFGLLLQSLTFLGSVDVCLTDWRSAKFDVFVTYTVTVSIISNAAQMCVTMRCSKTLIRKRLVIKVFFGPWLRLFPSLSALVVASDWNNMKACVSVPLTTDLLRQLLKFTYTTLLGKCFCWNSFWMRTREMLVSGWNFWLQPV